MSYVYAVRAENFIKFGVASNPKSRLSTMQTGCPLEMELIGAVQGGYGLESALHIFFKQFRKRGEWFHRVQCMELVLQAFRDGDKDSVRQIIGYVPGRAELWTRIFHNPIKKEKQPKATNEEIDAFVNDISLTKTRLYRRA